MGKYYAKVKNPSGASGTNPTGQLAREGQMLKTAGQPAQRAAPQPPPPTRPATKLPPPPQKIPVPQATMRAVQGTPSSQPGVQPPRQQRTTKRGTYSPY